MKNRNWVFAAPVIVASAILGCVSVGERIENGHISPPAAHASDKAQNGKLCIALSGGGIRAGSVALGFLQGLHEQEILADAQYVATVSGGGYPVYGLLHQASYHHKSVAELLSENSDFIQNAESNASFIDTYALVGNIVFLPLDLFVQALPNLIVEVPLIDHIRGRSDRKYHLSTSALSLSYGAQIHRTFGGIHQTAFEHREYLKKLERPIGFPYPIFLASQSNGRNALLNEESYEPNNLFEISPSWIGSDDTRYWNDYVDNLDLDDAIIMSGAAIDTPTVEGEQEAMIPDWAKRIGFSIGQSLYLPDGREVFLSDGGFIENQAVLPLLRRNCGEIVSLDATSDPSVEMKGWTKLRKLAAEYNLFVSQWENVMSTEDATGNVWNLPSHVWRLTVSSSIFPEKRTQVSILKLGLSRSDMEMYDPLIRQFVRQNHSIGSWPLTPDIVQETLSDETPGCNGLQKLDKRCAYPIEDTARQSYELDEFRAYRLLGKHMACEFALSRVPNYIAAKSTIDKERPYCDEVRRIVAKEERGNRS